MARIRTFARTTVLVMAAALIAYSTPPQQKKQSTKKADPFVTGAPFTFEQVLQFVRQNVIPAKRQKDAIQTRGLDFYLSPEDYDKLKAAGASDDMLQLLQSHSKPEPPKPMVVVPPPPPPKVGELILICAPAECEISLGGVAKGATNGGTIKLSNLQVGPTAIEFNRAGYVASPATVTVEMGKTTTVKATLEPDRQTKERFGTALFKKMLEALGGEAALREALSIQAEGSFTVWAADGSATRWSLFIRSRPDRALFQAQGGGGVLHEVAFTGSQFKTSKGLKGNDARELPTDFGLVRDRQLAGVSDFLSPSKFKMFANRDPQPGVPGQTLTAEGATQTVTIVLDNDLRPAQMKFTTATGLGSEIVTYADYIEKGKLYYPKAMQIRPDATLRGIEVHFDRVEIAPKLKDADYNLKGKPIPSLAK